MAKDSDTLAGSFETEEAGGLMSGFLAEEDDFDRRSLWRLGSWGVAAVAAVTVAVLANQSSIGWRRDEFAAADLARQSQQIQLVAKESQTETRRLASAIDTLSGDRDRLASRITVLEQGLDSVTGSIARQNAPTASPEANSQPATTAPAAASAPSPAAASVANGAPSMASAPPASGTAKAEPPPMAQAAVPATAPIAMATGTKVAAVPDNKPAVPASELSSPTVAPPAQTASNAAATLPEAATSMKTPPKAAEGKPVAAEAPPEAAAAVPAPPMDAAAAAPDDAGEETAPAASTVQRTEFAVDVGTANSVAGLRALWRGLLKSRSNAALLPLRPIIVVKEGTGGLGMQLRLAAGPLSDAAAAAKICAALMEGKRTCETTVFDGQQLTIKEDDPAAAKPASTKPALHRRSVVKRMTVDEPPKPAPTTLSSFFGSR